MIKPSMMSFELHPAYKCCEQFLSHIAKPAVKIEEAAVKNGISV